MIGDRYFQLQAQIGTSLYSLSKLERDLGQAGAESSLLPDLQAGLRQPFVFLTLGEAGAGKSALLNSLFDRSFAGERPFGASAVKYSYAAESQEQWHPDGVFEAQRPYIFLRDFTLVEMQGLDLTDTLTRFLPAADLILVVLSIRSDPSNVWRLLGQLGHEVQRRCVLVVQGSDEVPAQELPLILQRLRHLMLTLLGHACPLFAVSSQTRAGFEKLERYINSEIIFSETRCQKLRDVCDAGRAILDHLAFQSQATLHAFEHQKRQLEEERHALTARRDQSLRDASSAIWTLSRLFDSALSRGSKMLRRKLTVARVWKISTAWWREFHDEVETRPRNTIASKLAGAFEDFEADLRGAWLHHREVLHRLQIEPEGAFSHDGAALFARLAGELTACDTDGVTTQAARGEWIAARGTLQLPALAAGASGLAMLGTLFGSRFVPGLALVTALTFGVLLITLAIVRNNVLMQFRRVMNARREKVLTRFEGEVRAEIDRFHHGLAAGLRSLDENRERFHLQIEPAVRRMEHLREVFDHCASELDSHRISAPPERAA